ncbi:MAG: DUF551 domain-containing protein [Sarcina sp.]|nr:DUF551 domain-containing protein [Sarcina sp.]
MDNSKAIEIFNKWMDCKDAYKADPSCDGNCSSCEYYASAEEEKEAMQTAIAAIEKLEAIQTCTPPSDDWEHYADRLHDIAYKCGYEEGKQDAEQDRWILVTEKLPEDYSDVLVWFEYFRYGNYNRLYQTYGIGNYSAQYDAWTVNHETGWNKLRVIAWRPLPASYQEDKA